MSTCDDIPPNGGISIGRDKKSQLNQLNQLSYPQGGLRRPFATLPTNVAIPLGLAQVFIGASMLVCGSLALRYRSYLFYYGTGLWAGTISAVTGALIVMATKEGLPKPRWLCGGHKWQIHVVIGATMLALTAAVLLSMFSTSGLMQDTMHPVGVELETPSKDDETFERRKSSGVAINAILLLFAMLQILLSFCSLGIGLRILCRNQSGSSLFSMDSTGSDVTIHDILGSGPEYEARKDRLLRWLGHQGRNFFTIQPTNANGIKMLPSPIITNTIPNPPSSIVSLTRKQRPHQHHIVALRPSPPHPQILIPHPHVGPPPRSVRLYHPIQPPPPHLIRSYPVMVPVPLCPAPVPIRRSITPGIGDSTLDKRRKPSNSNHGSLSSSGKRSIIGNAPKTRKANQESKITEITEEEIGKTYTGLDRVMAEDFISNSMDKY